VSAPPREAASEDGPKSAGSAGNADDLGATIDLP
jgi:hypothetical protein